MARKGELLGEKVLHELKNISALLSELNAAASERSKFGRVSDVCRLLGWKPQTVYEKVAKGEIPCYKPDGKTLYFVMDEIKDYVLKSKSKSNAEISEIVENNFNK